MDLVAVAPVALQPVALQPVALVPYYNFRIIPEEDMEWSLVMFCCRDENRDTLFCLEYIFLCFLINLGKLNARRTLYSDVDVQMF